MIATDEELARAFVRRAPGALEETYSRHASILFAVARNALAGISDEAEDCVHDVILRLWSAPDSYRLERGALRAFLIVCVRNEALTRRRNAARHFEIEQRIALAPRDVPERFEERDHVETRRLRAAIDALPTEQRRVIELAYFANCSATQIARELDAPLGTIKSRASLGLRKLTMALGHQNHE